MKTPPSPRPFSPARGPAPGPPGADQQLHHAQQVPGILERLPRPLVDVGAELARRHQAAEGPLVNVVWVAHLQLARQRFAKLLPGREDVVDEVDEVARLLAGARLLDNGGDSLPAERQVAAREVACHARRGDEARKAGRPARPGLQPLSVAGAFDPRRGPGALSPPPPPPSRGACRRAEAGGPPRPLAARGRVRPRHDDEALAAQLAQGAQVTPEEALPAQLDEQLVAQGPKARRGAAGQHEHDGLGHLAPSHRLWSPRLLSGGSSSDMRWAERPGWLERP